MSAEVGRGVNCNTMVGYAEALLPGFPTTSLQESVGVSSLHFAMPWFLTLFSSLPCWDSVLAVWDLIILYGNYTHKCQKYTSKLENLPDVHKFSAFVEDLSSVFPSEVFFDIQFQSTLRAFTGKV